MLRTQLQYSPPQCIILPHFHHLQVQYTSSPTPSLTPSPLILPFSLSRRRQDLRIRKDFGIKKCSHIQLQSIAELLDGGNAGGAPLAADNMLQCGLIQSALRRHAVYRHLRRFLQLPYPDAYRFHNFHIFTPFPGFTSTVNHGKGVNPVFSFSLTIFRRIDAGIFRLISIMDLNSSKKWSIIFTIYCVNMSIYALRAECTISAHPSRAQFGYFYQESPHFSSF